MSPSNIKNLVCGVFAGAGITCSALGSAALAEPLALANTTHRANVIFEQVMPGQPTVRRPGEDTQSAAEVPARLRRQIVEFPTGEATGTIVIDTPNTYLYYVLGAGKAIRYGIGVGREGFTWSGVQNIARKAEWPDWIPPAEMLVRQPYLPRFMAGGFGNPLGARALYLGGTIYRIHGTNQPSTIGGQVSSGCIRMVNDDVIDLYGRVEVGTKVVVLPAESHRTPDQSAQIRSAAMPVSFASNHVRPSALH
jgi:lipoprotein-anchoring transpeptidase ErfK/SrfK